MRLREVTLAPSGTGKEAHVKNGPASSSTLTSQGRTTVPMAIRDHLKLRPGDRIDYVVEENGRVLIRSRTLDIRDLAGLLQRPGQRRLSVEEMNRTVGRFSRGSQTTQS